MAKKNVTKKRPTSKRADAAPSPRVARTDGWKNVFTGVGTSNDKRRGTSYERVAKIGDNQLSAMYRANGIGRRIVTLPADDVTRNWFTITNDEDDDVAQKLEELGAQKVLNQALKMARLYGGAIVVMGIDDGQDLKEPVNEEAIKAVDYLTVFDRRDITVQSTEIESDIRSGRFGQPKMYEVRARFAGNQFKVHASRVLRFDGEELPWSDYEANQYWHDSVLESAFENLRQLGAVYDSAEFITEDFIQTVIKIKNIMALMAREGGEALIQRRLQLLDLSRHVANVALIDTEEDYAKHSSTVSGLEVLLDRFMMALSAATGLPVTLLMGRSPAGQNATGDADVRFYYDKIRSSQRNDFGPTVETLIGYIFASAGFTEPDSWAIKFRPLQEPTAKEEGELYKLTAEGDAVYINAQVIDPETLGKHRFVGDQFDFTPPAMDEKEFLGDEDDDPPVIPPGFVPPPPGANALPVPPVPPAVPPPPPPSVPQE